MARCFFSTSRTQGPPHCLHTPRSLVPALMQGSTSLGGKVAKCASLNEWVGMVQTLRRLELLSKFTAHWLPIPLKSGFRSEGLLTQIGPLRKLGEPVRVLTLTTLYVCLAGIRRPHRLGIVEVARRLGEQEHLFVRRGRPVRAALRHRVRLVPDDLCSAPTSRLLGAPGRLGPASSSGLWAFGLPEPVHEKLLPPPAFHLIPVVYFRHCLRRTNSRGFFAS